MSTLKLLILITLCVCASNVYAKQLGDLFNVEIKQNASTGESQIAIDSSGMTYYFARIVSPDGEHKSYPVLIKRNDKKIKAGVELKWPDEDSSSIFPEFEKPGDWIEFETSSTTIDSPETKYAGWRDSVLEFQGGNLNDLYDVSWKKDPTSAVALALLNITVLPELIADSAGGKIEISTGVKKLIALGERLSKVQSSLKELTFYYTVIDVNLETIEIVLNTINGEPPESLIQAKEYFSYVKELIDNIGSSVGGFSISERERYKSVQMDQYLRDLDQNYVDTFGKEFIDEIRNKEVDVAIKEISSQLNKIGDDDVKSEQIIKLLLGGLQTTVAAYQALIVSEMPKKTEAEKEARRKIIQRVQIAKASIAAISLTNSILTDDLQKNPDRALRLLMDFSGAVIGLVFNETISSTYEFMSKGAAHYAKLGKAKQAVAKVGKGLQIGHAVGNKLLPFLYDWIFDENAVSANIADGKVSQYGSLVVKVVVSKYIDGAYVPVWSTSDNQGSNSDQVIYANKDEIFRVRVYATQKDLFDNSERSPWEIGTWIPPKNVFSALIARNGSDDYTHNGICVRKNLNSLGKTEFVTFSFTEESGDNTLINCTSHEAIFDRSTLSLSEGIIYQYNLETLGGIAEPLKLKSLDDEVIEDYFTMSHESGKTSIILQGYDNASFNMTLSYVSPPEIKITKALGNSFTVENLDSFQSFSDQPVSYVWELPDGTTRTTTDPSIDFTPSGDEYTIKLIINMKNGSQVRHEELISPAEINTPSSFKATRDGETVKFTWDSVPNAVSYRVYLSPTLFDGDSVILSDDAVDYDVNDNSLELVLDEDIIYYAVIQAFRGDRRSQASDFIEISRTNTAPISVITSESDLNNLIEGMSISLKGDTSSDKEGAIAAYHWLEGDETLGVESTIVLNDLVAGSRTISLTVVDLQGLTHTQNIFLNIIPNNYISGIHYVNNLPVWCAEKILVNNSLLYVVSCNGSSNNNLHVYDVRKPSTPVLLSTLSVPYGVSEIVFFNNYLHLRYYSGDNGSSSYNSFHRVDVTDPTNLVMLEEDNRISSFSMGDLYVNKDDLVYRESPYSLTRWDGDTVQYYAELNYYDISDLSSRILSTIIIDRKQDEDVFESIIDGDKLYTLLRKEVTETDSRYFLYSYDIKDHMNPVFLDKVELSSNVGYHIVDMKDGRLYLQTTWGYLIEIFDISNAANLKKIAGIAASASSSSGSDYVSVDGDHIYLLDNYSIRSFNIDGSTNKVLESTRNLQFDTSSLKVFAHGKNEYVINGNTVEISIGDEIISRQIFPDGNMDCQGHDGLLYCAKDEEIKVFDLVDNPTLNSEKFTSSSAALLSQNYQVYNDHIYILNSKDLEKISILGGITVETVLDAEVDSIFFISDDKFYLFKSSGIDVFDINSAGLLVFSKSLTIDINLNDHTKFIMGRYLALQNNSGPLKLYDIAGVSPVEISSIDIHQRTRVNVFIDEDWLYVGKSNYEDALVLYSLNDGAELGMIPIPVDGMHIDNEIYILSGGSLHIFNKENFVNEQLLK